MALGSTYNKYLSTEIKPMFKIKYLKEDISASIYVALAAIPLSLAVAIASGVSIDMALISAIVGGILGSIFGSTKLGITGPAIAMSVLLANSIQLYGLSSIPIIGIICGILQIIFGSLKLGRYIRLVPISLVMAFTAGIGFLLFFKELPYALTLNISYKPPATNVITNPISYLYNNVSFYLNNIQIQQILIVLLTIFILKLSSKMFSRSPHIALAVVIPTIIAYSIPSLHNVIIPVGNIVIPSSQQLLSKITTFDPSILFSRLPHLIVAALEIFLLASLETIMSSNTIDLMGSGDLHNPNQELIGQGISNIIVAIVGGIPVTGVIARSSLNMLSGAKTRRSAILQALIIATIMYCCPTLIAIIPIQVIIGILLSAALTMLNLRQVCELWKIDRLEVLIYMVTFLTIITVGLIEGVQAGLLCAFIIIGIRTLGAKTTIRLWSNKNVLRVNLSGNITFWSYEKLFKIEEFAINHKDIRFVIFEFGQLQKLDITGVGHLLKIARELKAKNIIVIFHNLIDEHHLIIESNSNNEKHYISTITEYEIKQILEANGVQHSAQDVLRQGMVTFISQYAKDNKRLITTLAKGQNPHTLLITCSDSRLNPNAFFSANIGELFIVRNVGNVIPPFSCNNVYSEVAAIEFALNELGIRNIVICAHTECGAVKAAMSNKPLPYSGLNNWLEFIRTKFNHTKPSDHDSGIKINLLSQLDNLKTYPIVSKLLAAQQLTIIAWIYDVHSGHMLEWNDNDFISVL